MQEFLFRMPTRVMFGEGVVGKAGEICTGLGAQKAFVITGRGPTKDSPYLAAMLRSLENAGVSAQLFSEVEADPSVATVERGAELMRQASVDVVIAFGGGSPIDAAKAMSILQTNEGKAIEYLLAKRTVQKPGIPLIAIPTTAGTGSEVTASSVMTDTENQRKVGFSHDFMMPRYAIMDPLLHVSMPPATTAATGLDALTHAIEAYVGLKAQPISDACCIHAIKLVGQHLRTAVRDGNNVEARSQMALASLLAGAGFANAGLGAVHGIAHAVGAQFGTAHGLANGIILPYVMEYCLASNLAKFRDIAIALGEPVGHSSLEAGAAKSVEAVVKLKKDVGIPTSLSEVGVTEKAMFPIVKDAATFRLLPNSPRKLAEADLENIVRRALAG